MYQSIKTQLLDFELFVLLFMNSAVWRLRTQCNGLIFRVMFLGSEKRYHQYQQVIIWLGSLREGTGHRVGVTFEQRGENLVSRLGSHHICWQKDSHGMTCFELRCRNQKICMNGVPLRKVDLKKPWQTECVFFQRTKTLGPWWHRSWPCLKGGIWL